MLPMRTSLPVTKLRKIMHYHQLMLQYESTNKKNAKNTTRKKICKQIYTDAGMLIKTSQL